ncbi:tetratricopeptide repeat protein, partial [Candidatus Binatia bacterium]|nr:tetratricopeptide repeat protein [Candidatus Binatia bacterium]
EATHLAVVPPPAAAPVPGVQVAAAAGPTSIRRFVPRTNADARAAYGTSPDVWAPVAESWKLNGRGAYADAWQIARMLPEQARDPQILRVKALTALWAHEDAEALRLARLWTRRAPGDVEARFALAQAHLQSGEVAPARAELDALARTSLDDQQLLQLASLQDWAGDRDGAIASCRAVLDDHADDPQALRRLAVLLESDGDDEEAARITSRARTANPDDASLELLAARLAAKLGQRDVADAGYRTYVANHPGDVDGRLEAARHAVNAGRTELAVDEYRAVIDAHGADGLRVELTRALLAAGRYAEAEQVARDAVASPEDGPEARLALAQSVYLQGRPRDASPLFADAADSARAHGADATFAARLAMAQDHDLDAYGLLGDQIEGADAEPTSAASPADLWLLRGDVARKRGDFRTAREDYQRASELGAVLRADVALQKLDADVRAHAGAGYAFFKDANRLEVNGGSAWLEFRPGDLARVSVQGLADVVTQHDARYTRTGGRVAVDELFLSPEWAMDGSFGFINSSAGGGDVVTGSLAVRRYFTGGSVLGLTGYREPLLGGHEDQDPRLWNRIIDLAALGPSFAINGGKAYGDWLVSDERRDRVWAQIGAENYEDGNLRGIFYAHYQLPLRNGPENWTVLRPNAFVEAFKDPDNPDYFSPRTHATVGLAGHTVQQRGRFRLEAELNPQVLVTNGDVGFGVHGLLDASVQLGPASVGISGFAFYDSNDAYWLARAMAHVDVVF